MNIEKLIRESHEIARHHGWWQEAERVDGTLDPAVVAGLVPTKLLLTHSEISEAVEELRLPEAKRGGPLGVILYECTHEPLRTRNRECALVGREGTLHKPVGFVIELADVAIRLADLCGALGIVSWPVVSVHQSASIAATLNVIHLLVSEWFVARDGFPSVWSWDAGQQAGDLYGELKSLAIKVDGDLDAAIEVKQAYNETLL